MYEYTYQVTGTAADGQTWDVSNSIVLPVADLHYVFEMVMQRVFTELTAGRAVFGFPGLGCKGPYSVTKFLMEKVVRKTAIDRDVAITTAEAQAYERAARRCDQRANKLRGLNHLWGAGEIDELATEIRALSNTEAQNDE